MLPCTICSTLFPYARACDQAHQGVCHSCASLNFSYATLDNVPHPAPREVPVPWLSRRELAAVAAYQRRVLALAGTRSLAQLVTEEP